MAGELSAHELDYLKPIPCPECTGAQIRYCLSCLEYGEVFHQMIYQSDRMMGHFVQRATRESEFMWAWSLIRKRPQFVDLLLQNPNTPMLVLREIQAEHGVMAPSLQALYDGVLSQNNSAWSCTLELMAHRRDNESWPSYRMRNQLAYALLSYEGLSFSVLAYLTDKVQRNPPYANLLPILCANPSNGMGALCGVLDELTGQSWHYTQAMHREVLLTVIASHQIQSIQRVDLTHQMAPYGIHVIDCLIKLLSHSHEDLIEKILSDILQNPTLPEWKIRELSSALRNRDSRESSRIIVRKALLLSPVTQLLLLEDPEFATLFHMYR